MSKKSIITILVLLIAVLSFIAAYTGVFHSWGGEPLKYTTVRGQTLEVSDYGIYRYNSMSLVAEGGIAWDTVTLIFAIPLLLVSLFWSRKDSIRGKLLLSGVLSYFFYQYFSYSVGWAFNNYFLIYVAIFSLSLFTLIYTVSTINIVELPKRISSKFPGKSIATFLIFVGSFFAFTWLGTIIPPIINNTAPDLKGQTTLVTQALDLGIVVPFCLISGVLLLKKKAYGYLFSSIVVMKSVTMSLALVSMVTVSTVLTGAGINLAILAVFSGFSIVGILFAVLLLKNIRQSISE